jgi:hypothetical protein
METETAGDDDSSEQKYKPYNVSSPNNSLILAQQNAGNIEVLKDQLTNVQQNTEDIQGLKTSVSAMQTQINNLSQQQSDYAQQMAGSKPVTISGTNTDDSSVST